MERQFRRYVQREIVRDSPVLGEVSRIRQHEGTGWHMGDLDNPEGSGTYERSEARLELTRDQMKSGELSDVLERFRGMAKSFAEQQSRSMFIKVQEATEKSGNVIDAGASELTPELFLRALEMFQQEFDPETGEPSGGMFVVHPDVAEKLIPKIQEWDKDPEFRRRAEAIKQKQFLAWRDRESRRHLAD